MPTQLCCFGHIGARRTEHNPLAMIVNKTSDELRDSPGGYAGDGKSPRKVRAVETMKWYYRAHLVLILNVVFLYMLILSRQALTLC